MISDPHNVNSRLYNQLGRLLDELEKWDEAVTIPQRISALLAIGRIQVLFATLRKENDDPEREGSSVRKYARAFTDAARRRTAKPRRSAPDPADLDPGGDDPADDAA